MLELPDIVLSQTPFIRLRKAKNEDLEFISSVGFAEMNEILEQAWNGKFNWNSWHMDVNEAINSPFHRVFVIEANVTPIGYLWCNEEENSLWITAIVIESSWQRKGIGRIIMKYLIKECLENEKEFIELGVQQNNYNANRFYSQMGFKSFYQLNNANISILRLKLNND